MHALRLVIALVFALACLGGPLWQVARPYLAKPLGVRVLGGREVLAGGTTGYRVLCVDPVSRGPRAGVPVHAALVQAGVTQVEARCESDARGEALVQMAVDRKHEGAMELVVTARGGTSLVPDVEVVRQAVHVTRMHRIMFTTDKPFYQPGQVVRMRALALTRPALVPMAGSALRFEVVDPKGNKVFKQDVKVSEFGVASATFALADVVNEGDYTARVGPLDIVQARADEQATTPGAPPPPSPWIEKTINVKPYVLPKFKVEVVPERTWYRPGETVAVSVRAKYFFGKPVTGHVEASLATFQAGFTPVAQAQAELSADGAAQLSLPLPKVLTGLETENGQALLLLKTKVTDAAGHPHEVSTTFTASARQLVVEAVPEAGHLVRGVQNLVYVAVTRPDGTPLAGARVAAAEQGAEAVTDAAGVAELAFTPTAPVNAFALKISDATGLNEQVSVAPRESGTRPLREALQLGIYREPDGQAVKVIAMTSRASDGMPAKTRVRIRSLSLASETLGAEHEWQLSIVPPTLEFEVEDEWGGSQVFVRGMSEQELLQSSGRLTMYGSPRPRDTTHEAPVAPMGELLLRTDDGFYAVGGTARLTVLSARRTGSVYLDVVREGQTLTTRTLALTGGRAELGLELTPEMAGSLRLHAYQIGDDGAIERSGKTVAVAPARGLTVKLTTDKPEYEPGAPAKLAFAVTDADGKPTPAVLGVDIVDEAVFALADFTPGLEKAYFAIEEELLKPRYQLKCSGGRDLATQARRRWCETPREAHDVLARLGRLLMAPLVPDDLHGVNIETVAAKLREVVDGQRRALGGILILLGGTTLPLTALLYLIWLVGSAWLAPLRLELRSKSEARYYALCWAAAWPALVAAGPGLVAVTYGGPIAAAVAAVIALLLSRFIALWSAPETRATVPGGPVANGGLFLLYAYGMQASAALLCRVFAAGPGAEAGIAVALLMPVLALMTYTAHIDEDACQPKARAEKAGTAGVAGGLICAAVLIGPIGWILFCEAMLPWSLRSTLLDGWLPAVVLALWFVFGPAGLGWLADGVGWLDGSSRRAAADMMMFTTFLAGFVVFGLVERVLDWGSPLRELLRQTAGMLFLIWLPVGPIAGYWLGRTLGLRTGAEDPPQTVRGAAPQPAVAPRLRDVREAVGQLLPLGLLIGGLIVGAWMFSWNGPLRSVRGDAQALATFVWFAVGPAIGVTVVKLGRVVPPDSAKGTMRVVEVMIVIAIIGVLAAIAVPNFKAARERANGRALMANRKTMEGAMEMAALDNPAGATPPPAAGGEKAGVRIRSYFPETLYSNPELVTGPDGRATVDLAMADSITTWRVSGLASSKTGLLGSLSAPIRVFQEFFIDMDLPVALTRGDQVALPVAVYNYLDREQDVKLELEPADWYELEGPAARTLKLKAGEVVSERFRITAKRAGTHALTVFGLGSQRKDAVKRDVEVLPRGQRKDEATNLILSGPTDATCNVPAESLDGMERLMLRLYPSPVSQVVEGLDGLVRAPHG